MVVVALALGRDADQFAASASRTLTHPAISRPASAAGIVWRGPCPTVPDSPSQPAFLQKGTTARDRDHARVLHVRAANMSSRHQVVAVPSAERVMPHHRTRRPGDRTDTSTLVSPLHPEASTARPSSVTPWQSSTTSCFRCGNDAAMAFRASSSSEAHHNSSVVTRGHPNASARRPTRESWDARPDQRLELGQCFARVSNAMSVSSSHSETLSDTMRGCITQTSCIVVFVTGRNASFR